MNVIKDIKRLETDPTSRKTGSGPVAAAPTAAFGSDTADAWARHATASNGFADAMTATKDPA